MAGNILEIAMESIRREMNDVADYMATGGILSDATVEKVALVYAQKAGVVEGLAIAERAILDAEERVNKEQEEINS